MGRRRTQAQTPEPLAPPEAPGPPPETGGPPGTGPPGPPPEQVVLTIAVRRGSTPKQVGQQAIQAYAVAIPPGELRELERLEEEPEPGPPDEYPPEWGEMPPIPEPPPPEEGALIPSTAELGVPGIRVLEPGEAPPPGAEPPPAEGTGP